MSRKRGVALLLCLFCVLVLAMLSGAILTRTTSRQGDAAAAAEQKPLIRLT